MNKTQQQRKNKAKQGKQQKQKGGGLARWGASPMPVAKAVRLNYVEIVSFDTTASSLNSFWYYQTSAYDPRGSLGGHQPLYYDQMATLYNRCRVDRIDYEVTMTTPSPTGHMAYMVATNNANIETNVELLDERPFCVSKPFNAGGGPVVLRGSLEPHKVLGVTRQRYVNDDQFSAAVGANPVLMAYLTPYVWSGPNAGAVKIDLRVRMVLLVHFFELARVSAS